MISNKNIILHSFSLSTCSWRIRIALHLKQLPFKVHTVDLFKQQHETAEFEQISSMKEVPVLEIDGVKLSQSSAILEYLDETRHHIAPLLPNDAYGRALVRNISMNIISGTQPYQSVSVLKRINKEDKMNWLHFFLTRGLNGCENIVKNSSGKYAYGNQVTIADLCIVPQLSRARMFNIDVETLFPTLCHIDKNCSELDAFHNSIPENYPDEK